MKAKFKLDPSVQSTFPGSIPSAHTSHPLEFNFQLDIPGTATPDPCSTSKPLYGDYSSDIASGEYTIQWSSPQDLQVWLKKEQEKKMIELRRQTTHVNHNGSKVYYYTCSRDDTGGVKDYTKKYPERERKIPSKWCSCPCCLIVKSYPNMDMLMGKYNADRSHPIGDENAWFTSLSKETHVKIAEMLCMKMSHSQIVRDLRIYLMLSLIDLPYSYGRFKEEFTMILSVCRLWQPPEINL